MLADRRSKRKSLRDASAILQRLRWKNKGEAHEETSPWLRSLGPKGPNYDPRIMPQLIDRIAERKPDKIYVSYPKSENPVEGFESITWSQFSDAINRAADWLELQIGEGHKDEVFAYLAGSKISSFILTVAAAKLGCFLLFMSPRNSLEGQLSLIDKLGCKFLITPEAQLPQTKQVLEARTSLKHVVSPEIDFFLQGQKPKARTFTGTFKELRGRPFWYVHSSGTTSLPKPVPWTHATCAGTHYELVHNYPEGEALFSTLMNSSPKIMNGFPLFHSAGMSFALNSTPLAGVECVLPPEGVPINSALVNKMLISSKAPFSLLLPPTVIEETAKEPAFYPNLLKQPILATGGAALSRTIGDRLAKDGLPVINLIASSETGILPLIRPSEWQAIQFANVPSIVLEDIGEGRFELVLKRVPNDEGISSAFDVFPDLNEYRTNDIYERHPDPKKPHLWVVAGRADDVIVLSNGEKFTPLALEETVGASREIKTAVVFGRQRSQAALLIEPADLTVCKTEESKRAFLERIWPIIEEANSTIPAHGRIVKTHMLLTTPEKGVLKTPKGSMMRSKMYKLYEAEMEELYSRYVDSDSEHTVVSDNAEDDFSMQDLKARICNIAGIDKQILRNDDNFFMSGFDSLHGTQLIQQLRAEKKSVDPATIYNNPTVRRLHAVLKGSAKPRKSQRSRSNKFECTDVASTIEELSKSLPHKPRVKSTKVALLTGTSTGLGRHLLHLARRNYSHVYVCIRKPVSEDQKNIRGVTYLYADLAAPQLGLVAAQWIEILQSVTHIVHNAWLVDFNHPLPYFTSNILGVKGLIDFAAAAHQNPRIWFASSIGTVAGMSSNESAAVPERIFPLNSTTDKTAIASMGYAQSKRAAELLLAEAGKVSGVRSLVCRIGQIAGSSTPGQVDTEGNTLPSWQSRDYIPTLLKSAKYLKAVPDEIGGIGRLDWTPIDHMACAVIEMMDAGDADGASITQVRHLVNPANPPKWHEMLPVIRKRLAGEGGDPDNIEILGFSAWIDRLEESAKDASRDEVVKNPAIKLLDFFRRVAEGMNGVPVLDTTLAQKDSKTIRDEPAMNQKWLDQWMGEWFEGSA